MELAFTMQGQPTAGSPYKVTRFLNLYKLAGAANSWTPERQKTQNNSESLAILPECDRDTTGAGPASRWNPPQIVMEPHVVALGTATSWISLSLHLSHTTTNT